MPKKVKSSRDEGSTPSLATNASAKKLIEQVMTLIQQADKKICDGLMEVQRGLRMRAILYGYRESIIHKLPNEIMFEIRQIVKSIPTLIFDDVISEIRQTHTTSPEQDHFIDSLVEKLRKRQRDAEIDEYYLRKFPRTKA